MQKASQGKRPRRQRPSPDRAPWPTTEPLDPNAEITTLPGHDYASRVEAKPISDALKSFVEKVDERIRKELPPCVSFDEYIAEAKQEKTLSPEWPDGFVKWNPPPCSRRCSKNP